METINKEGPSDKRYGRNKKDGENPFPLYKEFPKSEPNEPIKPPRTIDVHADITTSQEAEIPTDPDDIDTLLCRYMSGVATEAEQQKVQAYLAKSEENRQDYEMMCKAAEFQKFVENQQREEMIQEQRKVFLKRMIWTVSSIAAVGLICIVMFSIVHSGMFGTEGEDFVAKNEQGTTEVKTTTQKDESSTTDPQLGSDSVSENAQQKDNSQRTILRVNEEKNYASGTDAGEYSIIMVRPIDKLYEVAPNATAFTFSWEADDAVEQTLLLKDNDGNVILSESVNETYLKLDAGKYRSYGSLTWKLKVKFKDNSQKEESGTVNFK